MSIVITTCPECGRTHEDDADAKLVRCPRCGNRYDLWDHQDEQDPDYGGAFDGFNVSSDADPGL